MKRFVCVLLCAVIALSLTACGGDKGEASVQSVAMICGLGSVGRVDRFSGVVSPMSETAVNAAESSTIGKISVAVGDKVKTGDVLFTYDTQQTRLELERSQLELEKLKNTLSTQKKQQEDYVKLRDESSGDEQRQYALDVQEKDNEILETNYNISLKQKEIDKLAALLKNSSVTSPVDGSVQSINEPGSMDNYGRPLPLISLVETGGFRVKGYVNENNAASIYEGMAVILRSRVSDDTWQGSISMIDYSNPTSSGNNNYYYDMGGGDDTLTSSKYPFYVTLDDAAGLLLGQHVYIEPDYGQDEEAGTDVINLPEWYINDPDGNAWVWAQNKSGKLEKRNLKLGDYDEMMGTYAVLDGLTAEDYIAFPDDTLVAGMTCVSYDEDSFAGDMMPMGDMGGMDGEYYDEGMVPEDGVTDDAISFDESAEVTVIEPEIVIDSSSVEG